MSPWSWVALPCSCMALAACGGSDDDDGGGAGNAGSALSEATIQSYEGTYELTGFTMNSAGCDAEGASAFDSKMERSFVMVGYQILGTNNLAMASCADSADCVATVTAIRESRPHAPEYFLNLSSERGVDELGGFVAGGGFEENSMCVERDYTDVVAIREGDTLRIESRLIPLSDGAPEDGVCWAEPAKERAEAQGRPCTELQVITGTKVGPLP